MIYLFLFSSRFVRFYSFFPVLEDDSEMPFSWFWFVIQLRVHGDDL